MTPKPKWQEPDTLPIGGNIKKIRLQRNYTQKYIAQFLGMSHANYGKMENGIINISRERIEKIVLILEVSMEEITGCGGDL